MFGIIPFFTANQNNNKGDSLSTNIFSDFFNDDIFKSFNTDNDLKADIKETDSEYIVEAELPGVSKDNIAINYDNNTLSISALRNEIIENKNNNYVTQERHYGQITRSFYIENVDKNMINANFDNGVLRIDLPKNTNQYNYSTNIPIN